MFASVLVYSVEPELDHRSLPGKTVDRSIDLRFARYAATPTWLLSKPARGEQPGRRRPSRQTSARKLRDRRGSRPPGGPSASTRPSRRRPFNPPLEKELT